MENPYKTPSAQLKHEGSNQGVAKFERFSTWGVFGLSIITVSVYLIYWMYTRTKVLNSQPGVIPISTPFIAVVVSTFILSFLLIIPEVIYPDVREYALASQIVSIVSNILFLVWVFKYRNRLNIVLSNSNASMMPLGVLMTFFFQVIYLSYKTNEYIDTSITAGQRIEPTL